MSLIKLTDCQIDPDGVGNGIGKFSIDILKGDRYTVNCDQPDNVRSFLRVLATLDRPAAGIYRFNGKRLDLDDYRSLLRVKRKIAYIAHDAAVISNRSVRENLLLPRCYSENTMDIDLGEAAMDLCHMFNIAEKLEMRPSALGPMEIQAVVAIRELTKSPELLLLDRPDDFFGMVNFNTMLKKFRQFLASGLPLVFYTRDPQFNREFSNKTILIENGSLEVI